ncbi:MAG TPA: hypothetical protein VEM40_00180 [Nitrospirota bacterium]|nr:hypothetical protein [Nitrospirota bacterium]
MKPSLKIAALIAGAAVVVLILHLMKETSKPESSIIEEERARFSRSKDIGRAGQDLLYASSFENRLRFLDYRLAVAYNSENRPNDAITILERMIKEESGEHNGIPPRSRNYTVAAQYYEELARSYELKQDPDNAKKAMQNREKMLALATESRIKENLSEGKTINEKD